MGSGALVLVWWHPICFHPVLAYIRPFSTIPISCMPQFYNRRNPVAYLPRINFKPDHIYRPAPVVSFRKKKVVAALRK